MRSHIRWFVVLATAATLLALGLPASAEHAADPRTKNLHPMGHIVEPASLLTGAGGGNIHTDIAFWGKYAFQGSWLGFNIRDISAPGNPKHVSSTVCQGNQGDVIVWDDILVRSWNSPAPMGATCDGETVPEGFEGLHIFDVSNVNDPALLGSVDLSATALPATSTMPARCGSHTATGVPDEANNRLLVYNSGSQCAGIDIVEVPLDDPASASFVRWEASNDPDDPDPPFGPFGPACHDTGVILGDAMLAGCAGNQGFAQWSLDPSDLTDPVFVRAVMVPDTTIGHTATFSWDGEVLVFGHEPGGGVQANCQASNPDSDKSLFFYDTSDGSLLGTWVLPRPQSNIENCTIHNLNLVPVRSGRDIIVHGSYQSGTGVVDFTDRANAVELAYSDPPPIPPPGGPFCDGLGCEIGGVWSSYWYNNFIYETNITEGLNIFRFSGKQTAGAMRLGHLNPQTQEFTIP